MVERLATSHVNGLVLDRYGSSINSYSKLIIAEVWVR